MKSNLVPIGQGLYSQIDAARLLGIHPARIRRWVQGYTYYVGSFGALKKKKQIPLVEPDAGRIDDSVALSFLELMELRVIKALVSYPNISLQKIRQAAEIASRALNTAHPFASRRVFTDGQEIFAALQAGYEVTSDLIELSPNKHQQVQARTLIEQFLEGVDFDKDTSLALKWWPLGKSSPVVLDPRVAFGAPTIDGTRVRTSVLFQLSAFESTDVLAKAYEMETTDILAAVSFEERLAAA